MTFLINGTISRKHTEGLGSLGAFRLSPVRSDARVASLPQLWVPQSCCWAAQYLKRFPCLPAPTFDYWTLAADDLYWLWSSIVIIGPFQHFRARFPGAIELLRGWKVAQKIALFALSNVAERGIGSRGHALAKNN